MSVIALPLSDPGWVAFVSRHTDATPFHHPAWSGMVAECYGYGPSVLAVLSPDGAIAAGLPVLDVRSRFTGNRLVALPFTDFCPPLSQTEPASAELIDALRARVQAGEWPRVEVHWPLSGAEVAGSGVYSGESMARHVTQLDDDPEQVRRRFRSSVVRLIRQAEKAGVTIRQGQSRRDVELFYGLHLETRRRQGTPVQPRRFFTLLWEKVIAPGLGFVLLAYKDAQPVAGAVFLCWNRSLTYKYGASLPEYWALRPNNLLFWSAIQWGCTHGYESLDWGKTDLEDEGLRSFKRGWGADESVIRYSVVASRPPAGSARTYSRFLTPVIQRSPVWVGRAIGELLYGHFA